MVLQAISEQKSLADLVRIVLIHTTHPGNIGATARAMRVMGINSLYLVQPKFFPHSRATAMASGAVDVLENAQVVDTLEEALADCQLAYATTARMRHLSMPVYSVREAAVEMVQALHATSQPIAIVFGTERSGMTNQQIDCCQRVLHIPTANEYNSLNLAQAVQILCYEVLMAMELNVSEANLQRTTTPLATNAELEYLYAHLEKVMIRSEFLDPAQPKHLMRRLRYLFTKASLDKNEVNILRGLLKACEDHFV